MSTMHSRLLGCLMLGALLVSSSGTAAAGATNHAGQTRTMRGTALPALRHATLLRTVPATAPVDVVVSLKPRHPELLAAMAAASSGRPALSPQRIRRWFLPSASTVAGVSRYMRGQGFRRTAAHGLSLSFSGDADAVGRAFGVRLNTYRNTLSGRTFRAPDGAVELPADIASDVRSVSGLDTALQLQHQATASPALAAAAVTPTCAGPTNAKAAAPGSLLPADLAAAYGHDTLLANDHDGDGQGVGLVQFSTYKPSDIADFRACFGLDGPSATVIKNVPVNGGTSSHSGAIEVELDMEVVLSNAPGLDTLYVYRAPNNLSNLIAMLNRMAVDSQTTDLSVVSDSWGICEAALPVSIAQAESEALQLLAVNGVSFYTASGDFGSSGCFQPFGLTELVADDPASQPFATGVGGTTLGNPANPPGTAWSGSGGGVSMNWPMPSYQQGVGTPADAADGGAKCGNPGGNCRWVPDIALNANPNTGYIIKCSDVGCPAGQPWFPVGGTSAAAPLMAAITADANELSTANGGVNLGYANPCLYAAAGTSTFMDVVTGHNKLHNPNGYAAEAGFDLVTGLGSPEANAFAAMVQACGTHVPPAQAHSVLTATPSSAVTITPGKAVTIQGHLTVGGAPLANRAVYIELTQGSGGALITLLTDANGNFSRKLTTALKRNTRWQVFFPGSDTEEPAKSAPHAVYVRPTLGNTLSRHSMSAGQSVTVSGLSRPNLSGEVVALQIRLSTSSTWRTAGKVRVASNGRYGGILRIGTRGTWRLRWHYAGGKTKAFLEGTSDVESIAVH
jgi:subtilase family serine protease